MGRACQGAGIQGGGIACRSKGVFVGLSIPRNASTALDPVERLEALRAECEEGKAEEIGLGLDERRRDL